MAAMKIATYNVNSIKMRLEGLMSWLKQSQADVVCLQETKITDDNFPRLELESLGYNLAFHGQKAYNGVAILSKHKLEDIRTGLPGDDGDDHARYIEAVVSAPEAFRVAAIYLPNGNPFGTDKYTYKLGWMERLAKHAQELLAYEEALVLAGDYNVIPAPEDVHNPEAWRSDALFAQPTRLAYNAIINLGLTDGFRACNRAPGQYSFWDYQAGAWQKNWGLRIDHLLLSPIAADKLQSAGIDKAIRAWEKPSDHVPVWCEFGA